MILALTMPALLAAVTFAAPPADDAQIVADLLPTYPLNTCAVSGQELGSMGDPMNHVVDGRLVRLCCGGCVDRASANKDEIFTRIDEAIVKAQGADYPLDTCLVSGKALGDGARSFVVDGRLMKTCCGKCEKKAIAEPESFRKTLDEAYVKAQLASYPVATCAVSGKDLGSDPKHFLYGTTLVQVCCNKCLKHARQDGSEFAAKVVAARARATDSAPEATGRPTKDSDVEASGARGDKRGS